MENHPLSDVPFSKEEIAALRESAGKGKIPTLLDVRRYVLSTRISYMAIEAKVKPKDRTKKPTVDENQIDFF
jgi:hypothetical protein